MDVQRVLQFFTEGFHFCAFLQELPSKIVHLAFEDIDIGYRPLQNAELSIEITQLDLQHTNLIQPVSVL